MRTRRIRKLIVPIYGLSGAHYDLVSLSRLLHELIVFTLVEDIDIEFRWFLGKERTVDLPGVNHAENVCLFSGGVDSYAGLLLSQEALGEVEGVFCAHTDQARIIHIVADLQRRIMGPRG